MTPLESLTKKLHALLPELTELSFGCRINGFMPNTGDRVPCIYVDWDCYVTEGISKRRLIVTNNSIQRDEGCHKGRSCACPYQENAIFSHWNDEKDVLGHPITLEHVLKAVGLIRINRGKLMPGHKWLYVNQTGRIWTENWRGEKTKEIFVWVHGLPLDQQSPETIEFLDNLIPDPTSK